jgi:ParB family chromosome partitioning protein
MTAALDQLVRNRHQPREVFDEDAIERLAESIQKNGILQPIIVRRAGKQFEIIAGERRWRAARRAGLKEVPVVVRENVSDVEMLELALLENVQRQDLNPVEKARGYRRLMDEFKKSHEEIAKSVGMDRATIANTLRLLELPAEIQESVQRGALSGGHARALLSVPDAARRRNLFERTLKEDLSVRDVETLAAEQGARKKPNLRLKPNQPAWISDLESRWRRRLGVRVDLSIVGQRARIGIHCASLDELERVTDLAVGLNSALSGGNSAAAEM